MFDTSWFYYSQIIFSLFRIILVAFSFPMYTVQLLNENNEAMYFEKNVLLHAHSGTQCPRDILKCNNLILKKF